MSKIRLLKSGASQNMYFSGDNSEKKKKYLLQCLKNQKNQLFFSYSKTNPMKHKRIQTEKLYLHENHNPVKHSTCTYPLNPEVTCTCMYFSFEML